MIVSRFAPAPTGYLHLGHVLNAIYVWGVTRASAGRVLLRIEDHDRQRSRPEFERAILDDLDWLGFVPDEPPTTAFRHGPCAGRQSDRLAEYQGALERLAAARLTYACNCSRHDLRLGASLGAEVRYRGTCADKRLPTGAGFGIRVRLAHHIVTFDDELRGAQSQCPAEQCGDMLIRDRQGNWTYQFAATVDDMEQGVTLVVRGDDLLPSTGRQIQVARLLGRRHPPRFLHHGLVMINSHQKLSKSDGATSVGDLRRRGWGPADVIGRAAWLGELTTSPGPLTADETPALLERRKVR